MVKSFFTKHERKIQKTIIVFLLVFIFSISIYLSATTAPTSDEYTFVASGYSYWKTWDFRMNTEQPPLLKLIGIFPLLFMDINFPKDHPSWQKAQLFGNDGFYRHFIFEANNDKKETMLFIARATTSILSVLLALLVLHWSTKLFGPWAGILALALYSLEPTIIAYSSLFMMDLGFTFFSTLALYTLWKFLKKPTNRTLIVAAIAFGLVQLTKHTAIFFFGIYPAIIITYLILSKKKVKDYVIFTKGFAIMALTGLFFINAIYGFQGSLQTAQQMFEKDKTIDKTFYTPEKLHGNNFFIKFVAEKIPLPLPYHYIKGFGYVIVEAKAPRTTYLFGKTSEQGFWYYYLLSWLVKTPIPLLIMLLFGCVYFISSRKSILNETTLILPIIIFIFLFSMNRKQIGIRHILQVYPLIIIFTSRIMHSRLFKRNVWRILLAMLLFFNITEVVIAFPDYISYMNEIVGLDQGYKYFADTNIDISQDLYAAVSFIKQHPEVFVVMPATDALDKYATFKTTTQCTTGLLLTNANTINTNNLLKYLRCKQPSQRLGRTLFVYNITKC